MAKGRNTTYEERVEIVSYCIANGNDYTAAVEKYGVSYQQVYSWVRKYTEKGAEGLVDKRGKRKPESEMTAEEKALQPSTWDMIRLTINVPMIIYLAGSICKIVGSIGLTMLVSYYYTYAYGDMSMLTVYLTLSTVLQLIGATLAPVVNKIVKGNRNTFAAGMFIYAACLALAFVTGKGSALIFTVFLAVGYMGWAITHTADAAYYSYIGDLVEYKHHKNIQPFLMSMLSMVIKIGIVVSNMVVGWGLVAVGFDANNVTEAAKTGIMNLTVLLPCAVLILGGIITLFSPLNDRKVREIKEELDKRHTA